MNLVWWRGYCKSMFCSIGQLDIADRTARASEEEEAAKENTAIENPATVRDITCLKTD